MTKPTETFALKVGSRAPVFSDVLGADGSRYGLSSFDDSPVLAVVFISNGCPTVKAYVARLDEFQGVYKEAGVQLVAINSNNSYLSPADTYNEMVKRANDKSIAFPYIKDEGGLLARAYGAICTPHAFVFDQNRRLRYQGRIDDSRDPTKVEHRDLANAVQDLLADRLITVTVTAPFGCSIVW
jgi:thiol-disulfide isomerase/thioredoxin